jgi:catechol 2,3-dioxygenase-like lactoylglutathione lyase family enzyme
LLRAGATTEIDTRRATAEIAGELEKIAWRDQTVAPPLYGRSGRKGMPVIDHVILGVHHLDESRFFYEHALAPLGVKVVVDRPELVGFGSDDGRPFFWLAVRETTHRVHVAFTAADRLAVDAFHAAAMRAGGVDNGRPGLRPRYHENYYAAFAFDADGNNIEAVCHAPA